MKEKDGMKVKQFISFLPKEYRDQLQIVELDRFDEIRLQVGQPLLLWGIGGERWLQPRATFRMVDETLLCVCRQSVYAHQETIRHGFIALDGGHRIGISGSAVYKNGELVNLVQPSTLVFRLSRQVLGCADGLMDKISESTLLIGPPCSGKTTLLRDLIRQMSDVKHERISVVDERGEIASVVQGVPEMNVGCRTDILSYVLKKHGIMMMLRSMSPRWIAIDEITAPEDIAALQQAMYCGVKLLATAHASDVEDLYRRPLYRDMMQKELFHNVVVIDPYRKFSLQEV